MPEYLTIAGIRLATRTLALIAGIVLIVVLATAVPACVAKWRSERAQSRVDASQAQAASNSAADAINTVAASGEREAASEDLTRDNARDIANSPGAKDRVNSGVDLAGRKALCRRPSYINSLDCAMFKGAK